ncbi:MAG: metallophosphoesterase [Syntrophales bacterium]|nr:metallophosphoesterase [Syntrophales bacterium]
MTIFTFLLPFFLLYGGLHFYTFLKVKRVIHTGPIADLCLIVFLVTMVFAPLIVRLAEKDGFDSLSRIMSHTGYTWMGVLFLFFCLSLIFDIYHFLIYTSGLILHRNFSHLILSPPYTFIISLLISLGINMYGYFEAKDIRTERIIIKTPKLPAEVGRIRIVQVSDVHLGIVVGKKRLKRIVEEVKKAEPEMLLSTGDLLDGQINNLPLPAEFLRDLHPVYGKFAITGNHEFYAGLDYALDFTRRAGFTVLRGEGVTVAGLINIAGVDDPAGKSFGLYREVSEKELLSRLPRQNFTLLLKHQPVVDRDAFELCDLQLSGHTHKGQIFPFSLITRFYFPLHDGYFHLADHSSLYVSRGTGTWGPPIRFLSPPEVTIIELVHDNNL